MDANFRLKRKERGIQDKSLSDGLAYLVQNETYVNFLKAVPDYNEVFCLFILFLLNHSLIMQINSCDSTLHAVDHANKKGIDGLAATGVGGVSCARHCFNRQLGFADLQKGEKYALFHPTPYYFTSKLLLTDTRTWTMWSSPLFLLKTLLLTGSLSPMIFPVNGARIYCPDLQITQKNLST